MIICIGLFIVDVSFSDNERYLPFILGCQTVGNYRLKLRSVNQSVSQSVGQSFCLSVSRSVSQTVILLFFLSVVS